MSVTYYSNCGRRSGQMVSALYSGSSGLGSSAGQGHCVAFLGRTLNSHSASLYPGINGYWRLVYNAAGFTCEGLLSQQGSSDTPSHFKLQKPELSTGSEL